MIIDARSVPAGTVIDTDICIIGAGAAGITLARAFIDAPFRVALLESGGMELDPDTQDFYEGESVGQPFPDLATSRLRFFGGTTNHWGGWCLPLDAIDFEPRDDFRYYGWPFSRTDLDPWYERAHVVCQLGPYKYRPEDWGIRASEVPPPFAGPNFETKIMHENWLRFGPIYAPELKRAPRVTAYLHANASRLEGGENDAAVTALAVKTLSGNAFTVRARLYVVAAGGIENARLLLASGQDGGPGLGNAHDLVGRFFMVHPGGSGGVIVPADPHMNFDFQTKGPVFPGSGGRHAFLPFIGLSAASLRQRHLPNVMLGWFYQFAPVVDAVDALKRVVNGEGPGGSRLADLSKVLGNFEGVAEFAARKALFHEGIPIEALHLWCAFEQQPNPQSRITLGAKRDHLDMREVVVDWRLGDAELANAAAILHLLGSEVGHAGFGRLRLPFDNNAAPDLAANEHHMGTTRMHRDPAQGVVDENCRVHGVANLYVAGSSVFPTGGANNPTLTIVALALRLADHLKQEMT